MSKVNKCGRTYNPGEAIGESLRASIIDRMLLDGGDPATGFFGGRFKDIGDCFGVSAPFVSKLWKTFCLQGDHMPQKRSSGNPSHLKPEDVQLVEFLKKEKPSATLASIKETVENYCNLNGGTSLSAIGNTVRNRLPDGPFTRKKLTRPKAEKFTPQNLAYCGQFLNFISALPPEKIKFFDEAGVNSGTGNPVYGSSLKGTKSIEIAAIPRGVNITLNLLVGLEGILYANTLDGASNSFTFLNFFGEAGQATSALGNPAIEQGDFIIMDNCAIHRFEAGTALQTWLMDMGANVIYTPSLSPEFNAVELVFNKLKILLKREEYVPLLKENVHVAIYESLDQIDTNDMYGFYSLIL